MTLSTLREWLIRFRGVDPLIAQWKSCLSTFFNICNRHQTLSIGLFGKRKCLIGTSKLWQIVDSVRLTNPDVFHTSVGMNSARRLCLLDVTEESVSNSQPSPQCAGLRHRAVS